MFVHADDPDSVVKVTVLLRNRQTLTQPAAAASQTHTFFKPQRSLRTVVYVNTTSSSCLDAVCNSQALKATQSPYCWAQALGLRDAPSHHARDQWIVI
jgi:hypothetical protein